LIVGTGGVSKRSSGNGTIIYAMQVTETVPFADYCNSPKFRKRKDAEKSSSNEPWRRTIISKCFFYFGCNAVEIPKQFSEMVCGRGFKSRFSEAFVQKFIAWIKTHKRGKSGEPFAPKNEKGSAKSSKMPRCG